MRENVRRDFIVEKDCKLQHKEKKKINKLKNHNIYYETFCYKIN